MNIHLSIVIPTWNRSHYLEECITRVFLTDDEIRLEVIICDDGSEDNTPQCCNELQKKYGFERIIISRTETNYGAQRARNRGISLARGNFILFLDADDIICMDGVKKLVGLLSENSNINYAYGVVLQTDSCLTPLPGNCIMGGSFGESPSEIAGYHWHTMAAVYRRDFLRLVGEWNESLTGSQDWEYQARVKMADPNGKFIECLIGFWRHHSGNRVGANQFRPDYVFSVMNACQSIFYIAKEQGCCNFSLRLRLAKKLMIHSLEWGANNYKNESVECFKESLSFIFPINHFPSFIIILANFPKIFFRFLWIYLINQNKSKRNRMSFRPEDKLLVHALINPPRLISIMITTRNRADDLRETCRAVSLLNPAPHEIFITADGCTDNTVEVVRSELPNAILLVNPESIGSVPSRNRMMNLAKGDLVLSLDDDSYPEQYDCLKILQELFAENPCLAIVTFPQRTNEYPETLEQATFGEPREIRSFPCSGVCLRLSSYRSLRGFEPMFFHSYEEPDYSLQCVANGWKTLFYPKIVIRHHFSGVGRSELQTHHRHARNELWAAVMRCPFPYVLLIIIWRIFSQAYYAATRSFSWVIVEPLWWWKAVKGLPQAIRRRHPVSWAGYKKWLSLP